MWRDPALRSSLTHHSTLYSAFYVTRQVFVSACSWCKWPLPWRKRISRRYISSNLSPVMLSVFSWTAATTPGAAMAIHQAGETWYQCGLREHIRNSLCEHTCVMGLFLIWTTSLGTDRILTAGVNSKQWSSSTEEMLSHVSWECLWTSQEKLKLTHRKRGNFQWPWLRIRDWA